MSIELHQELSGPQGAPVVALSNSIGTSLSMWDPQAPVLAQRFRLLRYDTRGHGSSPVPPGPYEIADLAMDLLGLLDRNRIERASLCGLSIGAMTSIWVAAHAAERVERLILCCTAARFPSEAAHAYRERALSVRANGIEPIADAALGRWFTPAFVREHADTAQRMREGLVATAPEGYAGCCEAISRLDLVEELSRIQAPTLVIAGAEDPATPPEEGRLIAERIAGARLEVVPAAAHLANIEQSELVTQLIVGFLQ